MADKRLKKFTAMASDIRPPQVYGDADAELTFVTWGSTRGPVLDAVKILQAKGKKAKLVHFSWVYPFPAEEALKVLSPATRLIDVEQNATGQMAALIREHTGILIKEKILKYDGRPFFPEEIVEKVTNNI
jgi:2-oxoglutarate ferredoxin oxidoreductase subunit alpha